MIADRTVVGLTLRGLVAGRRGIALALVAALPVLAAVAASLGEVDPELAWARQVQRLIIPVVVAFIAVVISSGSVSDQRDDGTILYLASTPMPRIRLAGSLIVASWLAAMAIMVPSILLAATIALRGAIDAPAVLWPLTGAALAALAYSALGVWAAMVLRHPVVAGVLYILLWEGTFANWTDSAEQFSVAAYARALAVEGVERVNAPEVSVPLAVVALAAVAGAALVAAGRRLTRTELP